MQIVRPSSHQEVVHSWLKAEWYKSEFDPLRLLVDQRIIAEPNFSNAVENRDRLLALAQVRGPVLYGLPKDGWYVATFEAGDIPRTFVIPSGDWLPISGYDFRLDNVLDNVDRDLDHAHKIEEIAAAIPTGGVDPQLILVTESQSPKAHLTIIEGNNRAPGLIRAYRDRSPLLDEIFVGVSASFAQYRWHIRSWHSLPESDRCQAIDQLRVRS
jgi:hypothetical protein